MCQDFANQSMLKMPQVMHPNRIHGESFGQMRANGLDDFTDSQTELAPALGGLSSTIFFLAGVTILTPYL